MRGNLHVSCGAGEKPEITSNAYLLLTIEQQVQTAASSKTDTEPGESIESGKLYEVKAPAVRLRNAPAKNATIITELNEGEKVTIFEASYGWGKTFYNGKEVWVALYQLLEVNGTQAEQINVEEKNVIEQQVQTAASPETDTEPGESIESGKLYEVKASVVSLRNAPNKNATIITELNNGEKVTIFGESYGWGKTFYNGKEVWIALYLLDEKSGTTNSMTSEVNEKADPKQATEAIEKEDFEVGSGQKDEKDGPESEPNEKDDEKAESAAETSDRKENPDVQTKQKVGKTLSSYHFVIDPGHGGKDPGAIGSEIDEKTLTLSTAKKVEKHLRDKGASVTLTRADDTFIPLEKRTQISNSTGTDVFISLHYNAFKDQSVRGIHTFYYDGDENQILAKSIQKSLISHINFTDRGAKQADFQVLRDNKQPAILIELGFISNPEEQRIVETDSFREKAAEGIVAGLEDYFK